MRRIVGDSPRVKMALLLALFLALFLAFMALRSSSLLRNIEPTPQSGDSGGTPAPGSGQQRVLRLLRGEQAAFRDLQITLLRVKAGDPLDRRDDQAHIQIVSGTTVIQLQLTELETVFFQNYEITLEEVQPPVTAAGAVPPPQGRAMIRIRYIQPNSSPLPAPLPPPVS